MRLILDTVRDNTLKNFTWDLAHCNTLDRPEEANKHRMKTGAKNVAGIFGLICSCPVSSLILSSYLYQ